MPLSEVIRLALEAIIAHRFRAFLTVLGIVIGVTSIILLVSLGQGARNYVLSEFEGLGTNLIAIQPGKTDTKGALGHPVGAAQRALTIQDVVAIEKRALNLHAVTGLVLGTAEVTHDTLTNNVSVFGSSDQFMHIFNLSIARGDFFSREEDDFGRRVVVLGANVARNLFSGADPLGSRVKLNQSEFAVIGVMESVGNKLGFNLDDFVFVPTHAALRLFNDDKLFGIRAKARSRESLEDAVEELREILKDRRDGEEDFTIVTQMAMMESMDTILNMLSYVLGGIAALSMLVAGIGIMNIMLVSVTERTHEIGIRRAVGARRRDILYQFLAEATFLSGGGGLAGIAIALVVSYGAFWWYPSFDMRPPPWILPAAFMLSLLVGVGFGVWPARRASRVDTLEALRYE